METYFEEREGLKVTNAKSLDEAQKKSLLEKCARWLESKCIFICAMLS